MNRREEKSIERAKQEALATLGIYALERNDLESIMERAIDLSCIILDLDCAVIFSFDEDHGTLQIGAQAGCAAAKEPIKVDHKWDIGYALKSEAPTIVQNYDEDDRFEISPFLKDEDIKSSVNIVVKASNDPFGLLGFYSDNVRDFTEHEINFLQVVANIVGMAIEREQNQNDLRERNKQLKQEMRRSRQLQREILNNSIADRWQIGSFLHDNISQKLVSAKMLLNELSRENFETEEGKSEDLTLLNKIIEESIEDIRDLTHDIIPIDIEEKGVEHAFRFLIDQTRKVHGIKCTLNAGNTIGEIKNRKLATNIYHVTQEAVKNAALHAEADEINVSITKSGNHLVVIVEDDGIGLKHDAKESKGKGRNIMKYRVELLGGSFRIEDKSKLGEEKGTRVTCRIPLEYLTETAEQEIT